MASILVHLTHGPEAPTRAALAFLVAKSAIDDGHEVSMFLAGDAVQLLRPPTLDAVHGVGTGNLREHADAIVAGGGKLFASGMSSKARGLDPAALGGLPVEMATPNVLVQLVIEHDRTLTY
jgi:predicted peroxiredoxin